MRARAGGRRPPAPRADDTRATSRRDRALCGERCAGSRDLAEAGSSRFSTGSQCSVRRHCSSRPRSGSDRQPCSSSRTTGPVVATWSSSSRRWSRALRGCEPVQERKLIHAVAEYIRRAEWFWISPRDRPTTFERPQRIPARGGRWPHRPGHEPPRLRPPPRWLPFVSGPGAGQSVAARPLRSRGYPAGSSAYWHGWVGLRTRAHPFRRIPPRTPCHRRS